MVALAHFVTVLLVGSVAAFTHNMRTRNVRALKKTVRGPSSEPMVPYSPPGQSYSYFVPLSQRYYQDRTLFLGDFLDEQKSNKLIATLLYLREESPSKQITLYFNVPGALIKPSLAIYDVMQVDTHTLT